MTGIHLAPLSYPTYEKALAALPAIRAAAPADNILTRIEPSPYGGFSIKQIPLELYVDALIEGRIGVLSPLSY